MSRSWLLFLAFWTIIRVSALTNHTVDETDPSISYVPDSSWTFSGGPLDAGGNHKLTMDPAAYATFSFTGVAFYFMSALWPYQVTTDVSIDGQPPVTLDMRDYSLPDGATSFGTAQSRVVGSFVGLENVQHTVRISIPPGHEYGIVDMFIYTTLDPSDLTTTSTLASSTATSSTLRSSTATSTSSGSGATTTGVGRANTLSADSESSRRARTLAIALGVVGTVLGLILLLFLWWFCIRRRRMTPPLDLTYRPPITPEDGTYSPPMTSSYSAPTMTHIPNNTPYPSYGAPTTAFIPNNTPPYPSTSNPVYHNTLGPVPEAAPIANIGVPQTSQYQPYSTPIPTTNSVTAPLTSEWSTEAAKSTRRDSYKQPLAFVPVS